MPEPRAEPDFLGDAVSHTVLSATMARFKIIDSALNCHEAMCTDLL
jgi:hypothetical protein